MAELTNEEIAICERLGSEHEYVKALKGPKYGLVVVRKCDAMERTRLVTDLSTKEAEKRGAAGPHRTMARTVIVHPQDRSEVDSLLSKYPFLIERVVNASIELSEGGAEDLGNF